MHPDLYCPSCNCAAPPMLLGYLGNTAHLRCQYCGDQWGVRASLVTEEGGDE